MFRKLGLVFAAFALFSMAGGHWGLLQTVAWAEMLRDYSQRSGSLAAAAAQTFDGAHPCELCREIQAAKSKERKENPTVPATKGDAKVKALLADSFLRPFVRMTGKLSVSGARSISAPTRTEQPPTPPPRRGDFAV